MSDWQDTELTVTDSEAVAGTSREHLDYWTFSLLARERVIEEFPEINPDVNGLVLYLNRASGHLTAELETEVHKPQGLSWAGYRLLFVLWIAGDLEPHRAAVLTNTSRASVSSLSQRFIQEGLIHRRPSSTDGRSVVLSLADAGRDKVRAAFLAQDEAQKGWLSVLTDTEQEILRMLLAKMMESWTRSGSGIEIDRD
ncbi:MarR family winged helix-turn-helix transcriptional regulator [Corynebacterium sp. A21]|uniref:MarR family winged helix-turn-helix transcriptional regulator n=1 Tax=Corynebacterium sp. A21 TaxID=3457318 RepID=UPI003FCFD2C8